MICINSSEIASLVGYNKYINNTKFTEIFTKNLYKQREDLKEYDETNNDIQFITDEEKTQNIIKDLNNSDKEIINKILINKINDNKTLQENIKNLDTLLSNSTITQNQKNIIKNEINTKINCNYGIATEDKAIKNYENKTNNKVFDNNTKCYIKKYNNFIICGKIDGLIEKDDKLYINEIKNRRNNIFSSVPIYEKIQLLSYTKLLDINNIIYTQSIDELQHTEIFEEYKDEFLWDLIIIRLEEYSELIYKLRNDNILRKKYITNNSKLQYKYLKNNLSWL